MALARCAARASSALAAPLVRGLASSPATRDSLADVTAGIIADAKAAGTFKAERVITSAQRANLRVAGQDSDVLCMCSNNYLALCDDPRLITAAKVSCGN